MIHHRLIMVLFAGSTFILSSVLADGTIMEVKKNDAGLDLKTWTVSGFNYQLQCSTNPVSGTWENVGDQIKATQTTTNLNVSTEADSCWFRVLEEKVEVAGPTTPPRPPAKVPPGRPVRKS